MLRLLDRRTGPGPLPPRPPLAECSELDERETKTKFVAERRPALYYLQQQIDH